MPELKGRWIWALRAPAGDLVAKSPMSFATRAEAVAAIDAVRRAVHSAGVHDLVGSQLDDKP